MHSFKTFKTFLFAFSVALGLSANVLALKPNPELPVMPAGKDSVYTLVEKMPQFQGGEKSILEFIGKKIKYPSKALKNNEHGKVIVQFVVDTTGKVINPTVLRSVSELLDKEAIRVIGSMPAWTPGEQEGKPVQVSMVIPVMFKNTNDPEQWEPTDQTVVVLDDVVMPPYFTTNILNSGKFTSVNILKPFPKEEVKSLKKKYGKRAAHGVILIKTNTDDIYYDLADSVGALPPSIADCKEPAVLPQFPGGKEKMFKFIADSIQYPFVPKQTKKQGRVIVRFRVDKSGKVSDAQVAQSLDYFMDKEALRVIGTMPAWIPGAKCEHKLDIFVTMPVEFKLELPAGEKRWERNEKTLILLNGKRLPSSFDLKLIGYANLSSYRVLEPTDKKVTKKLVKQYGKDAANGVVLIETAK